MKRLLGTCSILLLLSASAFANSVSIFLSPNDGGGDNFGFIEQGNGFKAVIDGGTPVSFFTTVYAPGSTIGGSSDVFFGVATSVTINGMTFDFIPTSLGSLSLTTFTLPTNSKDFSILVDASFSASGLVGLNGPAINLGGSAPGRMTFHFDQNSGLYLANSVVFTTVPEPGTFVSLVTGLIGIISIRRWRMIG